MDVHEDVGRFFHDIKRCVNLCFLFSHAQPLLPRGTEGGVEIVRENRSTSTSTSPSTFQLRAACLLAGVGRMVNRVIRFFFNVAYLAAIPPPFLPLPLPSLISSLIKWSLRSSLAKSLARDRGDFDTNFSPNPTREAVCVCMCVCLCMVVFTRMLDIKDLAKPTGGEHCDYYWIRNAGSVMKIRAMIVYEKWTVEEEGLV